MLTKYEKETIIIFNDAEDTARVYTCNQAWMRKLDALCEESPLFNLINREQFSKEYEIPQRCVNIRKPTQISDETRAKRAARARELGRKRRDEVRQRP